MKRTCLFMAAAALISSRGLSGENRPVVILRDSVSDIRFSGNPSVDLFGWNTLRQGPDLREQEPAATGGSHKSPWLAAGMSLVLPGSGEFYAESYWKSAGFFAVEVAVWALAYSFDRQGDKKTTEFQNFANGHWSVVRYATWTIANAATINPDVNASDYNVLVTNGSGAVVGVNWGQLNALESALGNWYSHNLPPYGSQQYFELIGKYPQFNQGWDDADQSLPGSYEIVKANLTPEFRSYSIERGKANKYYDDASTAVAIALANHVLSAIDAAWSAGIYNSHVHADVGIQNVPGKIGETRVPVLTLTFEF